MGSKDKGDGDKSRLKSILADNRKIDISAIRRKMPTKENVNEEFANRLSLSRMESSPSPENPFSDRSIGDQIFENKKGETRPKRPSPINACHDSAAQFESPQRSALIMGL